VLASVEELIASVVEGKLVLASMEIQLQAVERKQVLASVKA